MVAEFNDIPKRSIFIPGNVPSSKNSKQWTGRNLIWSKPAREYREKTQWLYTSETANFLDMVSESPKPLIIGFYFVRDSRRKFDFCNPVQTVCDLMVSYGWIPDDNIEEIIPVPVRIKKSFYHTDKNHPGVYIIPL